MNDIGPRFVWPLVIPALTVGGLAGVCTLVVLAVRSALDARYAFGNADLWTALAIGLLTAAVMAISVGVSARRAAWHMRDFALQAEHERGFNQAGRSPEPLVTESSSSEFPPFDEAARRVLTLAQDEAARLDHNYLGTEHLLLGIIREGNGVGARALADLKVGPEQVRTAVEFIVGRGRQPVVGPVGLTPRAKSVIELAIDEARRAQSSQIGSGHLLLGLVREGEGVAAAILVSQGARLADVRDAVLRNLGDGMADR